MQLVIGNDLNVLLYNGFSARLAILVSCLNQFCSLIICFWCTEAKLKFSVLELSNLR